MFSTSCVPAAVAVEGIRWWCCACGGVVCVCCLPSRVCVAPGVRRGVGLLAVAWSWPCMPPQPTSQVLSGVYLCVHAWVQVLNQVPFTHAWLAVGFVHTCFRDIFLWPHAPPWSDLLSCLACTYYSCMCSLTGSGTVDRYLGVPVFQAPQRSAAAQQSSAVVWRMVACRSSYCSWCGAFGLYTSRYQRRCGVWEGGGWELCCTVVV